MSQRRSFPRTSTSYPGQRCAINPLAQEFLFLLRLIGGALQHQCHSVHRGVARWNRPADVLAHGHARWPVPSGTANPLTPEEMKALGIQGDTPRDTVATRVA